jgi:hypothetical protein
MYVGGVRVTPREVSDLAEVVDASTAAVLRAGLDGDATFVALSSDDRDCVLDALEIPWTNGLAELRSALEQDRAWRVGEQLS